MADSTIAGLTALVARSGTDPLPIFHSGQTMRITVDDLLHLSATSPITYTPSTGIIALTTVPVNLGGTGATTAAAARTALGIGNASTATLPISFANGGTSQVTQATAAYKLGVRWTNTNGAGMASLTPEFINQIALDNDNFLWKGASLVSGGWNGDIGVAGRFIAGGLTGASVSSPHIFLTHGLTDFATVQVRDTAQVSYAGYNILDWTGHQELTFNVNNNPANSYFGAEAFFLQVNPRVTDGSLAPLSFGISHCTFPGGVFKIWNWVYFNSADGSVDFFKNRADAGGQTSISGGQVSLHLDGTLGITGLTACSLGTQAGQGSVTITGAGAVTGAGTHFLTDFFYHRLFFIGGQSYHVVNVFDDTHCQVAESVSAGGGSAYTIYRSGASFFGITRTVNEGVHVLGGGNELLISGLSRAALWLIENGAGAAAWAFQSSFGDFSITNFATNKQPILISKLANTSTLILTTTSDVQLNAGNLLISVAGKGIQIKEGSNARMGVATLVAGTVTIANTTITANTRVHWSYQTFGGTPGNISITRSAGVSFTLTSTSATETSTVTWVLFEPA